MTITKWHFPFALEEMFQPGSQADSSSSQADSSSSSQSTSSSSDSSSSEDEAEIGRILGKCAKKNILFTLVSGLHQ